ncbi:MAG TPA: hypothetical protein VNR89_22620 [Roseomonas sp.]|nr:hypothetical protein [Roseomonas sp.]
MSKISKALAVAIIGMSAMAMSPSQASAAWTCGARSATGSWGVGWSRSIHRARRIALYQCALRTPRGYYCRITTCA